MTDTNDGTAPVEGEAPVEGAQAPAAAAAPANDELASLRSRNSGLNAKVTSLETERNNLRAELENARKGLTDKEAGDSALRAQLAEANAALEAAKKEASLAALKVQYPEAFSELGAGALSLTPDKLASLEARLTAKTDAGAEPPETPRPVGNNPPRSGSGPAQKSIEDMTSAEIQAAIRGLSREDFGLPPR